VNPRATLLLVLAAAALGAFVYFYEWKGAEQRKQAEADAKRLYPDLEQAAIDWIALVTTDGKAAEVERKEGTWRLTQPLQALGDPVSLDGMAEALAQIAAEKTIEAPQAPEVYGLGEGAKVIRFRAKGQEQKLLLGKRAPVGAATYASPGDPQRVLTVPTYRATSFDKALDDLRERRILRFDRNAVEGITVSWPGSRVVMERAEGSWRTTEPVAGPADEATVEKLLSDTSFLRADGFLEDATPDAKVGLDQPALVLELRAKPSTEGGEPAVFRMAMGPPLPDDPKQRAVRTPDGTLVRVAVERIVDVPRDVMAYRFKELAKFPVAEAQRVEITFHEPDASEAVVRNLVRDDASGWKLEGEEIVSGKATRLVAELSRLRADAIMSDAASVEEQKKLGLAPPRAAIRVFGAKTAHDEPLLATVELGISDEKGTVAKPGQGDAVYRLSRDLADHVPASLAVWREKFVAKAPPPAQPATPDAPTPMTPEATPGPVAPEAAPAP
jgi:hypothetical protein